MSLDPGFTGSITDDLAGFEALTEYEAPQTPDPDPDGTFDILFDLDDDADPDDEPGDEAAAPAFAAGLTMAVGLVAGHDKADFPGRKVFRIGRSSPAVARLGSMLIKRGGRRFYRVGAGPEFGVADRNACAAFQRAQGWTDDGANGYPGPRTWELLVTHRGKDIAASGGPLRSPVPGYRATYAFGIKDHNYSAGWHTGRDYAAPQGTPIVAVVAGTVIRTDWGGAYGNWTQIRGRDGHVWMYAHQSRRTVRSGAKVRAGQVIGYVGATGHVTGPHLHLEESTGAHWAYGKVQNPSW